MITLEYEVIKTWNAIRSDLALSVADEQLFFYLDRCKKVLLERWKLALSWLSAISALWLSEIKSHKCHTQKMKFVQQLPVYTQTAKQSFLKIFIMDGVFNFCDLFSF